MLIFCRSKQFLVVSGMLLLVLILITSCQNTPVMTPSLHSPTATLVPTDTLMVPQSLSRTATMVPEPTATTLPIPTETQELIIAPIPSSTPGPTPTAIQVAMLPGDCTVTPALKGQEVQVRKVGSTICLIWADDYDNETGFRVVLQFGYDGEMFVYDSPANNPGMPYPPILSDTQGGSFEYCIAHKDYSVNIYVLLPSQKPKLITGYSPALECNRFTMPSATPQPPTTTIIPN